MSFNYKAVFQRAHQVNKQTADLNDLIHEWVDIFRKQPDLPKKPQQKKIDRVIQILNADYQYDFIRDMRYNGYTPSNFQTFLMNRQLDYLHQAYKKDRLRIVWDIAETAINMQQRKLERRAIHIGQTLVPPNEQFTPSTS